MTMKIKVLDKGYVELIASMGTDETVIEAARMSTGRGFERWDAGAVCGRCRLPLEGLAVVEREPGARRAQCEPHEKADFVKVPGDAKLLEYLYSNGHTTPFEMCELHVEVYAPILVWRQWHRHRAFCLAGSTRVYFDDLPGGNQNGTRRVYTLTMEQLWQRWENALWPRSRVQEMQLRCLNEETREFTYTRIVDVIRSEAKPLLRVTTASGNTVSASKDHRILTNLGWLRLDNAISQRAQLVSQAPKRVKPLGWEGRLVPRFDEIVRIEELPPEVTYDLSVAGPWHNFVAEGVVVHNSYNEFSARYGKLPDDFYVPTKERLHEAFKTNSNKQASGSGDSFWATDANLNRIHNDIVYEQVNDRVAYEQRLTHGMAPELARINVPGSQYKKCRVKTDLHNWLGFLRLRMHEHAQHEIRAYACAVAEIVKQLWPRSYALFEEHTLNGVRFSATEAAWLREMARNYDEWAWPDPTIGGTKAKRAAFFKKLGVRVSLAAPATPEDRRDE